MAALREEESSNAADLYRRIASGSSGTDEDRGHLYRSLDTTIMKDGSRHIGRDGDAAGGSATVSCDVHPSLEHTESIPLPNYITNVLKDTKLSSQMGILPDANIVWVSVDDALYLWEYQRDTVHGAGKTSNNADDFVCFKVPSGQCIVSLGLVKPKVGKKYEN